MKFKSKLLALAIVALIVVSYSLCYSRSVSAQELGAGAKFVDERSYVFAQAKLWILSVELGIGGKIEESFQSLDYSLAGKIYPIEIFNVSPYIGGSMSYTIEGNYQRSRAFGGVEFDLPTGALPFSVFAGSGANFTESDGLTGYTFHLGIKYSFVL